MRKNRMKPIKMPPAIRQVLLILIGFTAGYTANVFVPPAQNSQVYLGRYQPSAYLKEGETSVCFTPNKRCQLQVIGEINKAKVSILVQAYSFTDWDIVQALVAAAQRSVKIKILLDKSNRNDKRSVKDVVIRNNLPLRFDSPAGIAQA